jgi:hypothetical protein
MPPLTAIFSFGQFEFILLTPEGRRQNAVEERLVRFRLPSARARSQSGMLRALTGLGALMSSGSGDYSTLPGYSTRKRKFHLVCSQGCEKWQKRYSRHHPPDCKDHREQMSLCRGCEEHPR